MGPKGIVYVHVPIVVMVSLKHICVKAYQVSKFTAILFIIVIH